MSWNTATLSTVSSLTKWERNIADLSSNAINEYLEESLDISSSNNGDGINVESAKGGVSVVCVADSDLVVGGSLSVAFKDSADDITYSEINAGSRSFYDAATTLSEDDILFYFRIPSHCAKYIRSEVTAVSCTGTISIYTIGDLTDKIEKAKVLLGLDIEQALNNRGYVVDYSEGEVLLDIVNNSSKFATASDFKTLMLIFEDLANNDENSEFYQKMRIYEARYSKVFNQAINLVDLDTNLDGTTDDYKAEAQPIARSTR